MPGESKFNGQMVSPESAKADFALLLPRLQSPRNRAAHGDLITRPFRIRRRTNRLRAWLQPSTRRPPIMSELTTPPRPVPPPPEPARAALVGKTRRTPNSPCLNCGDPTPGNFCPMCGQRKAEVRISLRRMLMEVLDDQFSLNSALPRTLGALFFRPGHLSREYVAGRIARYIPPFRLYLVSSVVFFVVISLFSGIGGSARVDLSGIIADDSTAAPDSVPAPAAARADSLSSGKDWTDEINLRTGEPHIDAMIRERLDRFRGRTPQEAGATLFGEFMEHAPTMMFVLLPLFAGVMKLIYLRRKRFYVEHFVFALHVHAFVFLTLTASVFANEPVDSLLSLWMMIYIYWAMKRFYAQGWFRTLAKYCVLGFMYSMILGTAFIVTAAVSFFLL